MYKFLGLYLLVIIGIFIEFSFLGSFGNTVIKLLILSSITYFLYDIWKEKSTEDNLQDESELYEEKEPENLIETDSGYNAPRENIQPVFDIEHASLAGLYNNNESFRHYLKNQFLLIWDYIYPKNGYIIYKSTNDSSSIMHKSVQPQINIETEHSLKALFTLIDNKNGILIENNIEQTLNLFPFYQKDDYQPKSLLGFVTRIESGESFYWVFDSDLQDTFNLEDLKILEKINTNSEAMIKEVLQSSGLTNAFYKVEHKLNIADKLNKASSVNECLDYFCDFIVKDFEASKLTIATRTNMKMDSDTAKIYQSIGGDDPYKAGFEFPLDQGLNGWVITKNKPHLIENIEKGDYFVPRFSEEEKSNYGIKSYLSVPIAYNDQAIGMVTLEDKVSGKFSTDDKKSLIEYTKLLANALYRFEDKE